MKKNKTTMYLMIGVAVMGVIYFVLPKLKNGGAGLDSTGDSNLSSDNVDVYPEAPTPNDTSWTDVVKKGSTGATALAVQKNLNTAIYIAKQFKYDLHGATEETILKEKRRRIVAGQIGLTADGNFGTKSVALCQVIMSKAYTTKKATYESVQEWKRIKEQND